MTRSQALCVATFGALLETGAAQAGEANFRLATAERDTAVRAARRGALDRLSSPNCREVLSDFQDAAGRTLRENLAAVVPTADEYLGLVFFYDGEGASQCRNTGVLAFTAPGSRVVHVCPQFASAQRRDRRLAEVIVIHEVLHSLGLGENPPTSRDINARIVARCGR
jgi:hypothetical protein